MASRSPWSRRTPWGARLRRATEPSGEDMRRWRKLVSVAAKAGSDPLFPPGDVALARNRCRQRTMPKSQQTLGSPLDRLCRLTDRWGVMLGTARIAAMPELAALAAECEAILNPPFSSDRERRSRRDLDDLDD